MPLVDVDISLSPCMIGHTNLLGRAWEGKEKDMSHSFVSGAARFRAVTARLMILLIIAGFLLVVAPATPAYAATDCDNATTVGCGVTVRRYDANTVTVRGWIGALDWYQDVRMELQVYENGVKIWDDNYFHQCWDVKYCDRTDYFPYCETGAFYVFRIFFWTEQGVFEDEATITF